MGDFRKKYPTAWGDSEGKNLAGKYLTYNGVVCQRKKKLYQQRFGNKNLTQTKAFIPFPPPVIFFFSMRDLGQPSWIFADMI